MRKYSFLAPENIYLGLVLAFPFLVLFSPRIPILFTHARLDELLVLLWLPFSLQHYVQVAQGYGRKFNASYFRAFLILFAVFLLGLLYGEDDARWNFENIKLVTRPIIVIINILVVRYWIYRSNASINQLVFGFVVAVMFAGAVGYFAMFSPALAERLDILYGHEYDFADTYSFNMAGRAMSVFGGYDHASITYALGSIMSLFLFFNFRTYFLKAFAALITISLMVAIISSARIGFVALLFGVVVFLVMNMKRRIFITFGALLLVSLCLLVPSLELLFPENKPIERFLDAVALFDFSSSSHIWERSSGVSGVLFTQVYGLIYPEGADMVLGFGDNGKFISDVGYVTIFVKYGMVGLVTLFSALFMLGNRGYRTGKKAMAMVTENGGAIPISMILPGLMTLFIVGSFKGGLYFLTYKTGELFAFILALCIIEGEKVFGNDSFYEK